MSPLVIPVKPLCHRSFMTRTNSTCAFVIQSGSGSPLHSLLTFPLCIQREGGALRRDVQLDSRVSLLFSCQKMFQAESTNLELRSKLPNLGYFSLKAFSRKSCEISCCCTADFVINQKIQSAARLK